MTASIAILAVLGFPLLIAISSIWRGYAFSILWGWFVVPLFGLPALSIPFAIGLSLTVGFLTHQMPKEDAPWGRLITAAFFLPAVSLLIGWIVAKFI